VPLLRLRCPNHRRRKSSDLQSGFENHQIGLGKKSATAPISACSYICRVAKRRERAMAAYEVEIEAEFPDPAGTKQFARQVELETGFWPTQSRTTVMFVVTRHGDEVAFTDLAERLGGKVQVRVLQDRE
jgi:hypothetical protein